MPRRPRLFVPGCLHHIMARGLDGMDIFHDDYDRTHFLQLLSINLVKTGMRCYAWVLMTNHYHLVVRSSHIPLSVLMKPLNAQYARFFNKRYKRRGYLFQDRFKSVATQEQLYTEELIRYAHLNPLRAGICKDLAALDTYAWSGHSALMGRIDRPFQDTESVLHRFADNKRDARKTYRNYLEDGLKNRQSKLVESIREGAVIGQRRDKTGLWVLGDRAFVVKSIGLDKERRVRIAKYVSKGWGLDLLCMKIAEIFGIKPELMLRRGRNNAVAGARKVLAYVGHRRFDIPVIMIAKHLNVGGSAVSMMLEEGEKIYSEMKIELNE